MKPFSLACLLVAAALIPAPAQNIQKSDPFTGQWDLTVTPRNANDKAYPDWMEVGMSEGVPSVRIQPRGGSAFYAKQCKVEGKHLNVQWGMDGTTWDLDLKGAKLVGVEKHGARVEFAGHGLQPGFFRVVTEDAIARVAVNLHAVQTHDEQAAFGAVIKVGEGG